ncbi:MAG: sugar phosphate isomerase/epimerase [Sphaerochaetaceae bacterium]|nr:sugar phosphate isomerase/epimerase [Sphaerochaetaceae bacterium]
MMKRAVCNELFGPLPFDEQCKLAAENGLQGLEIAPYTIADDQFRFPASLVDGCEKALRRHGLDFAGLHWLLTKPDGMRLTSDDKGERNTAIAFLKRLVEMAGDLGGGELVLGGPKQRNAIAPVTTQKATEYLIDAARQVGEFARARNCWLCIEALPVNQSNIINTLDEARAVVEACDGRGVSSMFDFHNTLDERESWERLIVANEDIIKHVHVNTMEGGVPEPTMSDVYRPAFKALKGVGYKGWISLEIFFQPDSPVDILRTYRGFLDSVCETMWKPGL